MPVHVAAWLAICLVADTGKRTDVTVGSEESQFPILSSLINRVGPRSAINNHQPKEFAKRRIDQPTHHRPSKRSKHYFFSFHFTAEKAKETRSLHCYSKATTAVHWIQLYRCINPKLRVFPRTSDHGPEQNFVSSVFRYPTGFSICRMLRSSKDSRK